MEALEHAENMEHVIILYQNKKEVDTPMGFITTDETEIATANYMIDSFKSWIFTCNLHAQTDD
jgi:hypothetical protein